MFGSKERNGFSSSKRRLIFVVFAIAIGLGGLLYSYASSNEPVDNPVIQIKHQPTDTDSSPVTSEPSVEATKQVFNKEKLQETLLEWHGSVGGFAGVVIAETDGTILASINPDREFFAASIYKLYVAHEGYKAVDKGELSFDDQFLGGKTRGVCLDLMIRNSDSPCAEKMWAELGKQELTDTLVGYGIEHTSMTGITTTASDAARMLSMIEQSTVLGKDSQTRFLASMKDQVYRDAMNKGFSQNVVVYNKIGFREQIEYHDVAIVDFGNGKKLIIAVLTERVGTRKIADLATRIESVIQE